ncbi:hypothetical protein DFH09DRAFT_1145905, partial [Mycena vulgaris]
MDTGRRRVDSHAAPSAPGLANRPASMSIDVHLCSGNYWMAAFPGHQEYFVLPNVTGLIFLEKNPKLPWTVYVGAAGMPGSTIHEIPVLMPDEGKTAYFGWKEYSHAKKGETAFITTGA